jgi:hypothetical protein
MEEIFPEGSEDFIRNIFSSYSFANPTLAQVSEGIL